MNADAFKPIGLNHDKLKRWMAEHALDGVLLASPENVFYTTGFPTLPGSGNPIVYALRNQLPFYSFIDKDANITLLAWAGAAMGMEFGTPDVRTFFMYGMAQDELTALVREKLAPGCAVGFESVFPYQPAKLVEESAKPGRVEVVDEWFNRLRLVKTLAEVERIRKSTQIIDKTVMELTDGLRLGMTRLELIQQAKTGMLRNGAGGVDHVTVAFGTANPEVALDEVLERNQIVTLDLGAVYEGYVSDNRRLVYTGKLPEQLRDLHTRLCRIVADMGAALKPGKTFADLHAYAFELYAREGVDPLFLHVGHSIGLQVDEHWMLGDDPTPIEPGMVLNIELYSGSDEGVMVGDEETWWVKDNGVEKLSTLPVEIMERIL